MKKYLKLLFVALFATMTLSLTSCNSDEPEEFGSIVGTWKYEVYIDGDYWQKSFGDFEENGKCTSMDVNYFMGDYDVTVSYDTWSQSGKKVEIGGDKGTIKTMTSNSMVLVDDKTGFEMHFTRCPKEEMEQYLKYAK